MEHRAAWQLTRNAFVEYQDWAYGHVQHDSQGALWLQYWLYYYHQDSIAIGDDHEGDWEMAQVRLGSDQTPDLVAYRQHQDGERCSWAGTEKDVSGNHPKVYVARTTHASYFREGTHRLYDHNDNNGDGIIPQVLEVQRDSPGWVGWPGTWGGPEGAGGPEGPRFSLSGALWEDPGDWVPTVNNCT